MDGGCCSPRGKLALLVGGPGPGWVSMGLLLYEKGKQATDRGGPVFRTGGGGFAGAGNRKSRRNPDARAESRSRKTRLG